MRDNHNRRNRFRTGGRSFRRNGSHDLSIGGINSASKNFQRRSFSRNGLKAEILLEKYNNLAKEALSNGDKILSENYYQHADHFLRIIENQSLIQNNSKPQVDSSVIKKNSEDKIVLENEKSSSQEPQTSSQEPQNSEEI